MASFTWTKPMGYIGEQRFIYSCKRISLGPLDYLITRRRDAQWAFFTWRTRLSNVCTSNSLEFVSTPLELVSNSVKPSIVNIIQSLFFVNTRCYVSWFAFYFLIGKNESIDICIIFMKVIKNLISIALTKLS
jgi:hypothetical protein